MIILICQPCYSASTLHFQSLGDNGQRAYTHYQLQVSSSILLDLSIFNIVHLGYGKGYSRFHSRVTLIDIEQLYYTSRPIAVDTGTSTICISSMSLVSTVLSYTALLDPWSLDRVIRFDPSTLSVQQPAHFTRRSWLEIIIYTKMCRPAQPQSPSRTRTFLQATTVVCTALLGSLRAQSLVEIHHPMKTTLQF